MSGTPPGEHVTEYLVGGYGPNRGGRSDGIGRATVVADGRIEFTGLAVRVPSPSWLTMNGGVVHAALEETGEVASFRLEGETLRMISRHPTAGAAPCHLAVVGNALIVASYRTGLLGVHFMDDEGGAGPLAQTLPAEGGGPREAQDGPHAHHVLPLVDGRVLSLDLGADKLHIHQWSNGLLTRIDSIGFPPGTGPRDLRQLPGGRIAALGEWGCDVHILAPTDDTFRVVASTILHGANRECQAAGLDVSSDGRFLYAGLRGTNRISVVALEGDHVRPVGSIPSGGLWPRHLTIHGNLLYVSNQHSDTVASFRLGFDGLPVPMGEPVSVPSPSQLMRIN